MVVSMGAGKPIPIVASLLLGVLLGAVPFASQTSSEQAVDQSRLEVIEMLSESLANDLLDLSLAARDRDVHRMAEFFPVEFSANLLPAVALPVSTQVKWVGKHQWAVAPASQGAGTGNPEADGAGSGSRSGGALGRRTREEFLASWSDLLTHFAEVEDVRFKVRRAEFDESARAVGGAKVPTATVGSRGKARIAFYIIGRDMSGQREWTRGLADTVVERAATGRWQIQALELISLESLVGAVDLFSEVSQPAGVALHRPAFGSPGNTSYVWHGAAAADFNRDGWLDLFVTAPERSYLYLNDGRGRFQDASELAGLHLLDSGVAPLALDYDNDGDKDVFLSAVGPQILLENRLEPEGKLIFRDVSLPAGVAREAVGFSATAADVNGDAFPDIYVTGYNHYGRVVPNSWFRATNGTPNLLFVNQGDGTFREEAARWGVNDRRWSYAAAFADVNGDGQLDLYVANDFGEKALYIHQGDRFVDEAEVRGVLDPGYGMGVAFGDYNNDGLLDLHVANMSSTAGNRILSRLFPAARPQDHVLVKLAAGNSLFENTGAGRYRDVTAEVGSLMGAWAWGGGFLDFDNDGWEDLFTPNGFISGKSMKDT